MAKERDEVERREGKVVQGGARDDRDDLGNSLHAESRSSDQNAAEANSTNLLGAIAFLGVMEIITMLIESSGVEAAGAGATTPATDNSAN